MERAARLVISSVLETLALFFSAYRTKPRVAASMPCKELADLRRTAGRGEDLAASGQHLEDKAPWQPPITDDAPSALISQRPRTSHRRPDRRRLPRERRRQIVDLDFYAPWCGHCQRHDLGVPRLRPSAIDATRVHQTSRGGFFDFEAIWTASATTMLELEPGSRSSPGPPRRAAVNGHDETHERAVADALTPRRFRRAELFSILITGRRDEEGLSLMARVYKSRPSRRPSAAQALEQLTSINASPSC